MKVNEGLSRDAIEGGGQPIRPDDEQSIRFVLRETLEELIEGDEEEARRGGEFTDEERELLLNALSFGELQVWDVMVPRSDINTVDIAATLDRMVEVEAQATDGQTGTEIRHVITLNVDEVAMLGGSFLSLPDLD